MVIFKPVKKEAPKYGRFFLAHEAPGDPQPTELENQVATTPSDQYEPAGNTRVINVVPGDRVRRLNFDADDPDAAQANAAPPEAPQAVTDPAVTGDQSIGMDVATPNPDSPLEPSVADANATNGAGQADPNGPVADNSVVDPTTDVQPDATGAVDGPDIEDQGTNLNFSDDAEGGGEGAPPSDPNTDGEQSSGHGIDFDSTRRYNLFKDFMALYTTTDGYIDKLENILSDDADRNYAVILATKKLREVKSLTKDYMLLRFESSTYTQNLLFYELMKTITMTTIVSLKKTKDSIDKEQATEAKKRISKQKRMMKKSK